MMPTARCGIAGLDENLRVRQAHASMGIASLDHAGKVAAAAPAPGPPATRSAPTRSNSRVRRKSY